jgi:parallel beta-helix repeat protein
VTVVSSPPSSPDLVAQPAPRGWRRVARTALPITFVVAMVLAAALALPWFRLGTGAFSHHYPGAPGEPSGNVVGFPADPVPSTNIISAFDIPSLAVLAQALPPNAIALSGSDYELLQPVEITGGARVTLAGPGTLTLQDGSYLEVTTGASLAIRHLHVAATGPIDHRGFLVDVGGVMELSADHFRGLGRVATFARGISFLDPARGSGITGCSIEGGSDGIFATLTSGLRIHENTVSDSRVDGIVLQGTNTNDEVSWNNVSASGRHGIVLSGATTHSTVEYNQVSQAGWYGILVYNSRGPNLLFDNNVSGAFDDVVLDSSSSTTLQVNSISSAARFAVRISGGSKMNRLYRNSLTGSPVGVYIVRGSTQNYVLATHFDSNGENVRIRRDSPGNVVRPHPTSSELASA